MYDSMAGIIKEDDEGFHFQYDEEYLNKKEAEPISLTIPLSSEPFFDGLIPEGWLLNIAVENWKLNPRDRMSILLATCTDCIGAVSIIEIKDSEDA